MTFANITIKGVDLEKYRKIKAIAAEEDENVAVIVNKALEKEIKERTHKVKKINTNDSLFRLAEEAVDYGLDTDVINADKYIYQ